MFVPRPVEVAPRSTQRLARLLGPERSGELDRAVGLAAAALDGRRLWNISSTAAGGGVAEMLHLLVGYARGAGVDARWTTIGADAPFFAITKRIHNRIHGVTGDAGALGAAEAGHYLDVLDANARALTVDIRPGDLVLLHDPQTAGLAASLTDRGATVLWRCHIGTERSNGSTDDAWAFLLPHLDGCRSFVFSRPGYVPAALRGRDVRIIQPSIDPLSPKNRPLAPDRRGGLLRRIGLLAPGGGEPAPAVLAGAGPVTADDRLVVQVSRWDRLKDMAGVLQGFAEQVDPRSGAKLALVGPAVDGVADDPEQALVLEECLAAWEALPPDRRRAVRLVALPMDDVSTNARMVNAIQRQAAVVVQKSLEEGFGLTVTEAMWKSRPVVASAVGGIVDQVTEGTGLLLDDPRDLDAFGRALRHLLATPREAAAMGRRGRRRARDHFLTDRHLTDLARLVTDVASG